MASQTAFRLPTVDFSQVTEPGTEAWDLVRTQIDKAIGEYGCFEAIYPKLPPAECQQVFSQLGRLFALPAETRLKNIKDTELSSYLEKQPSIPLFESVAIQDGNSPQTVESFADLMWPDGSQGFSETLSSWVKNMSELGEMVRRMILQILGVEKYYHLHLQSSCDGVHAHQYRAPENGNDTLAMMAHTDASIITILLQSGDGFEFRSKAGEWHRTARSQAGTTLVLIGEAFRAWSNGRLNAPMHRVTMTGEKERFTIGLFTNPKRSLLIKAPEELVDEQHPLLFKPYYYYDYLQFLATSQGGADLSQFAGIPA